MEQFLGLLSFMSGRFVSLWSEKARLSMLAWTLSLDAKIRLHGWEFSILVEQILQTLSNTLKNPRNVLFHPHFNQILDQFMEPKVSVSTFHSQNFV